MYNCLKMSVLVLLLASCTASTESATNEFIAFTGTPQEQQHACEQAASSAPAQTTVEYVGNIWREEVNADPDFTRLWDQVTAENAGKWRQVEGIRNEFTWEQLDKATAYAQSNAIPYKFHTIVWGAQQPNWLSTLTTQEQLVAVEQWFEQLAVRYPNLKQIDVVNEPLHAPPVYREALNLMKVESVPDQQWLWVRNAFYKARNLFPSSELLLNDFNILKSDENTRSYLDIIRMLQSENLIDGIGVQGHFLENIDTNTIKANLNKLGQTGLPVYVSEFDLDIENDQEQSERMQQLFPVFYRSEYVKGITFWGYRQNQIWQPHSHLIKQNGVKRPAMQWLECYLSRS